ncbi:hypothetical protein GIB67_008752, partial [Kingdonia uniflora]
GALLTGSELVKILVGSGDGDLNKKKIASSGKNSLAERTVPVLTHSIQVITDSIIKATCIQVLFSVIYYLKSAILPHSSDLLTLSMKALQKGTQKEKMAAIKLLVLEEFFHIVQAISCTLYRHVSLYIVQFSQTPADVPLQINNKANSNKVEASTNQVAEKQMPVYQLPSKILCRAIDIQLKVEADTDEVFV